MAYQQAPPENGTIFLSPNNSQNPKAPQFKGRGKDDLGRDIEVAYWEGVSATGKAWKRLKIGPPYKPGQQPRQPHPDTPRPRGDPWGWRQDPQQAQAPLPGTAPVPPEEDDVPF